MSKKIKPALKWHGGKNKLAKKIHKLAPPTILENPSKGYVHRVYAYGGGLGEMYDWECDGISEVANDINHEITNFWRVLQYQESFDQFKRRLQATPFSRIEFEQRRAQPSTFNTDPDVDLAIKFFITCRMSRSGGMRSFASFSKGRTRRRQNEQVSAWMTAVDGLDEVRGRILRIAVECQDAPQLIIQEDTPRTLFYLDPTYLADTVSVQDAYDYTMTDGEHVELLETITSRELTGYVMLSGYASELYSDMLKGWHRADLNVPNSVAGGKQKSRRIESIWMNYEKSKM